MFFIPTLLDNVSSFDVDIDVWSWMSGLRALDADMEDDSNKNNVEGTGDYESMNEEVP